MKNQYFGDVNDYLEYGLLRTLAAAFAAGHSLLVYQHFPREKREVFIARVATALRQEAGASAIWSLRTPRVVSFLATQPTHEECLRRRIPQVSERWHPWIRSTEHTDVTARTSTAPG